MRFLDYATHPSIGLSHEDIEIGLRSEIVELGIRIDIRADEASM